MRSKMLWIVLTLLSFNILHDSFMVLLDQNRHTSVVCYTGSEAPMQECDESCERHKIFHLMAIVTTEKSGWIRFQKENILMLDPFLYSQPHAKSAYKPPIA